MKSLIAIISALILLGLQANASTLPADSSSRGGGTFNEKYTDYTMSRGSYTVPTPKAGVLAHISAFSYVANSAARSERPVIFISSGGFSSSSAMLHILAFGPKRLAIPDNVSLDASIVKLVNNKHSPLDVADLVFYDPPGTGYSHGDQKTGSLFISAEDDAQVMAEFVRAWAERNARTASPIYLFGESYGTIRVTLAAQRLAASKPAVNLKGIMLLGQALNYSDVAPMPSNIIGQAALLPTYAATAWHHKKIDAKGRSFEEFLSEAKAFASTDYLTSLYQGRSLAQADRAGLAKKLEGFTGIASEVYVANNLRLSVENFQQLLLKSEGKVLSSDDTRFSNLGGGRDGFEEVLKVAKLEFEGYLNSSFNSDQMPYLFESAENYSAQWDFGKASPFSGYNYVGRLLRLMNSLPDLRVAFVSGYTDVQTPFSGAEYAFKQYNFPADRSSLSLYEGGHQPYTVEKSIEGIANVLRRLVSRNQSHVLN